MALTITNPGGDVQLTGNEIYINTTTDTVDVTMHYLLCKITSMDGEIKGGPWVDEMPVVNGAATFRIKALLDTVFKYTFALSDNTAKVNSHPQMSAYISARVGESYIDANGLLVETWGETVYFNALKGILTDYEIAWLTENNSSFYAEYIQGGRFLTHFPTAAKILNGSRPKLWFIPAATGAATVTMQVNYKAEQGTVVTHNLTASDTQLYEINCNPVDWGFAWYRVADAAEITSIIIEVAGAGYGLSHVFTVDYTYYENINQFYFVNRLSGIDEINCTGQLIEENQTEGEAYITQTSETPTVTDATLVAERKKSNRRFKCNTGFLQMNQRTWLLQLLESQNVWWITNRFRTDVPNFIAPTTQGNCIPVHIVPGTYTLVDSEDDIISVTFEFELAL